MNRHRKLPPLHALRAFEATARRRSFSLAAEELSVTQGAISKQIKQLESWYGIPLLHRTTKQLRLTEEGAELSEHLTVMLDDLATVTNRLLERNLNHLRLMVNPTLAVRWLFPRLANLQRLLPETQLRITTKWTPAEKQSELELENYDLILHCAREHRSEHTTLRREQLVPACTPQLLASRGGDWEQVIRGSTLLHPSEDFEDWQRWLEHHPIVGVSPQSGLTFDTLDMPITLACQGHGVALADPFFIMAEIESGQLTIPASHLPYSGWAYYLIAPANPRRQPAIDIVRNWLLEQIRLDTAKLETLMRQESLVPLPEKLRQKTENRDSDRPL